MRSVIISLLAIAVLFDVCIGQGLRPNGAGTGVLAPVEPGDGKFEKRDTKPCNPNFRSLDGTCTNPHNKTWGSSGTAQFTYFPGRSSAVAAGADLKSPRLISNMLCAQVGNVYNRKRLSEFVVFFGQFLDHCIISTPTNKNEDMPIDIPADDPIFGNFSDGKLPFKRSVRAANPDNPMAEQPINSLSSAVDLAAVYSSNQRRLDAIRSFKDGKLRTSKGNLLPLNDVGLVNAPTNSDKFFLAGDHRANEHPVLTSLHTLFSREHNRLCDELKISFPAWDDEKLFQTARHINSAQFQKVVYTRWFKAITGRKLPRYRGFKKNVNPTVSAVFGGAAFRVGHTMVGGSVHRYNKWWKKMPAMSAAEMFFRPVEVMKDGVEVFLRGAIYSRAQEVDHLVMNSLRNFLFTNVKQETGVDLVALNIQRGRDHNLPSYNDLRELTRGRRALSFADISKNKAVQSNLHSIYGHVEKVEAWVGLVCEDHARGSAFGPTLIRIWKKEFARMRDGDKFFYRNKNTFSQELWRKFPRLRQMMREGDTMKAIILRNSDMAPLELHGPIWRAWRNLK